jgi:predicted DNA-binding protein (MmcQ/YjbR family)
MNFEELREYCIAKKGVTEGFPFDEHALVFKVGGKMFALTVLNKEPIVNLKCDPERAEELREEYSSIKPGFHMSKKHWNTIDLEGDVSNKMIGELIDDSYDLVVKSLTKKQREILLNLIH